MNSRPPIYELEDGGFDLVTRSETDILGVSSGATGNELVVTSVQQVFVHSIDDQKCLYTWFLPMRHFFSHKAIFHAGKYYAIDSQFTLRGWTNTATNLEDTALYQSPIPIVSLQAVPSHPDWVFLYRKDGTTLLHHCDFTAAPVPAASPAPKSAAITPVTLQWASPLVNTPAGMVGVAITSGVKQSFAASLIRVDITGEEPSARTEGPFPLEVDGGATPKELQLLDAVLVPSEQMLAVLCPYPPSHITPHPTTHVKGFSFSRYFFPSADELPAPCAPLAPHWRGRLQDTLLSPATTPAATPATTPRKPATTTLSGPAPRLGRLVPGMPTPFLGLITRTPNVEATATRPLSLVLWNTRYAAVVRAVGLKGVTPAGTVVADAPSQAAPSGKQKARRARVDAEAEAEVEAEEEKVSNPETGLVDATITHDGLYLAFARPRSVHLLRLVLPQSGLAGALGAMRLTETYVAPITKAASGVMVPQSVLPLRTGIPTSPEQVGMDAQGKPLYPLPERIDHVFDTTRKPPPPLGPGRRAAFPEVLAQGATSVDALTDEVSKRYTETVPPLEDECRALLEKIAAATPKRLLGLAWSYLERHTPSTQWAAVRAELEISRAAIRRLKEHVHHTRAQGARPPYQGSVNMIFIKHAL
ncbi:hypothetical protein PAPYR_7973 [Paratrimastix pyriformis]|uniref:Uncharacterized protein n=1 Tax=Paratrimastix pyriformis TaxID=342808 RepID=A0ABQ8UBK2_9EUKA|nr:hypothetical protein PAPYR_7973 [Paratrimastix pyriformis]